MVPDSNGPRTGTNLGSDTSETDGGPAIEFDDARLYSVVREAVKDALLDVIGTVLLVGVAFVLVGIGGQAVVQAATLLGATVGLAVAVVGVYVAAATLELVPSIWDWL